MPITDISNAVKYYLDPAQSEIPYLGTVYQALPKIANEQDLFTNTYDGQGLGAVIYMFFTKQLDTRIALGGQHSGRKYVMHDLGLLIVFKSDLNDTESGQLAYNGFIDALTEWIRADRNAGTEAVSLGGFGPYAGTGIIFQWGEGNVNNGPDISFEHSIPRTADGGVTIFQSVAHINVVEILNT